MWTQIADRNLSSDSAVNDPAANGPAVKDAVNDLRKLKLVLSEGTFYASIKNIYRIMAFFLSKIVSSREFVVEISQELTATCLFYI